MTSHVVVILNVTSNNMVDTYLKQLVTVNQAIDSSVCLLKCVPYGGNFCKLKFWKLDIQSYFRKIEPLGKNTKL